MKVLVNGSNGQLGWELQQITAYYPHLEFFFYNRKDWDISNTNLSEKIIRQSNADYLINAAAYTQVDKAESDSDLCYKINTEAPHQIAKICRQTNTVLILPSTDYVFNGQKDIAFKETEPKEAKGVYALSKSIAEDVIMNESQDNLVIRTSWLYSSHGHNFVKTILRLAQTEKTLRIVNDQIGSPTYTRNLAEVILELIRYNYEMPDQRAAGIFHYSNEGQCSWFDFAAEIIHYSKLNVDLAPISTLEYNAKAHRPAFSTLDCSKIKQLLHLKVPNWKTSLHECLDLMTTKM